MNFLAHIYLSGDDDEIAIGNFIADSVRGKTYQNYPEKMQQGILLHRAIDAYTDAHPTFRLSTRRLHKRYRHYAGVIVDIFYDHFLAKNWNTYSDTSLPEYAAHFYGVLKERLDVLPERIQHLTPYMIADNWLVSYAEIEGIARVLQGMSRRTRFESHMNFATEELQAYYPEFEAEFTAFFDDLIDFSKAKLKILSSP